MSGVCSKVVYLSAPYSSEQPEIAERRFHALLDLQVALLNAGITCINPLANALPFICQPNEQSLDYNTILDIDLKILARCDEMVVLALPGWSQSEGVKRELEYAITLKKPVTILEENVIQNLPNAVSGICLGEEITQVFKIEC